MSNNHKMPDCVKMLSDVEQVSLTIPKRFLSELRDRAEKNGVSLSKEISWTLYLSLCPKEIRITKISESEVSG